MTFIHQPTEFEKQKNDKDFIERLKLFCKNQLEEKPKIMSKQTVTEWLQEQYYESEGKLTKQDFEQAKEMEKQQLIDAHTKGYLIGGGNGDLYDCKQYYNETFKK